MTDKNRVFRLAARPEGMIRDDNFKFGEEPRPELREDGHILVRNLYLSVDPTQRGWLERDSYMPAVAIGEVVRSFGMGRVVASRDPGFAPGDIVNALVGWQDYAVLPTDAVRRPMKVPAGIPLVNALSTFGLTGLTAYFGLLEIGRPQAGETVVVSGAAGATGMMVGQIAKVKGCRVIGIAGGKDKCAWLTGELGFDAAMRGRNALWRPPFVMNYRTWPLPAGSTSGSRTRLRPRRQGNGAAETSPRWRE